MRVQLLKVLLQELRLVLLTVPHEGSATIIAEMGFFPSKMA